MTKREQVLAVLAGGIPDVIPTIGEAFMDRTVQRALGVAHRGEWLADAVADAELLKKNDLDVGAGINSRTLEEDADHRLYEYETGARWVEKYTPTFNREAVKYPVNAPEDVASLSLPDMHDPARYEGMAERVEAFHRAGYFVQAGTGGIWSGSYYFVTAFENILTWMAAEPQVAHEIFAKIAAYVLAAAEEMLTRGVDAVNFYDDLGSGQSLLFSRQMYRTFIKPWHRKAADLCHTYGKVLHVHSHGHIQDVMDDIVDTGVDILNPVGPSDHNDLAYFKKRWGGRITFLGGISTTIARMTEDEIERHVAEVMAAGCPGGRFMPRTESGIPMMPAEKARFFIDTLYKYRVRYGRGQ